MEGAWQHVVLLLLVLLAVTASLVALGFVGGPSSAAVKLSVAGQGVAPRSDFVLAMWSMSTLVRRVFGPVPRPPTRGKLEYRRA
jgi:hypothetical protein